MYYLVVTYLSDASPPPSCSNTGRPCMSFRVATKILFTEGFGQQEVQYKQYQYAEQKDGEMKRINAEWPLWSVAHDSCYY